MAVKIGISPVAWQNDDLPELTDGFTMDDALRDAATIGYAGIERGRRMPADTDGLRAYLDRHGLALCGGWCSGSLLANDVETEIVRIRAQVEQFAALDAPCIVYAECSNTVQGSRLTPVSRRPKLTRDELGAYGAKLGEVALWSEDQGLPMVYHHHMGAIVEDAEDIDWLMDGAPAALRLLYDTGHLDMAGGDVMAVLRRWGERVGHVHYKDVRADVVAENRARDGSFLDAVVAGAFTVPGDPEGSIDFGSVTDALARMDYDGWIVVEAEQDPARVAPFEASKRGYEHVLDCCAASGLATKGGARCPIS